MRLTIHTPTSTYRCLVPAAPSPDALRRLQERLEAALRAEPEREEALVLEALEEARREL